MKTKLNYKKIIFWIIVILLLNEVLYRFALGPSLDVKNRVNQNINLIEELYVDIEKYEESNGMYPKNTEINNFIGKDDIYWWNKYGFYKLLNNNKDFIVGIKLTNTKYVDIGKIKGNLYNDFYYKSSFSLSKPEIENIYSNFILGLQE